MGLKHPLDKFPKITTPGHPKDREKLSKKVWSFASLGIPSSNQAWQLNIHQN
jgi:hypothetical protein